jgi:phosphonate transport system permease protein
MVMKRNGSNEKARSPIPGPVAALCSLIIPGLGQVVAGAVRRGMLLFFSLASMLVILFWRIHLLAHREIGILAKTAKAFDRRPFFVGLLLLCTGLIWIWNAWDGYRQTRRDKKVDWKSSSAIFVLIIIAFFAMGWQISEINIIKMITELPDAIPPMSRVLWPWKAAVTREAEKIVAGLDILIGCEDELPPLPDEVAGEPYLLAEPRCGELSRLDENNEVIKGTPIMLTGKNFVPNTKVEIWWIDPLGNEFRPRQEGEYVSVVADREGSFRFDLIMPYRLIPPSAEGRQIHRVEAQQVTDLGKLMINDPLKLTLGRMAETIFMGMMATFFGIIFAIPVSFLAARNLMSGSWITMAIYYITRTVLNIVRAIEPLIWALVAVVWVGLGPFAGIIALTFHSIAALAKLYSEAIESIDPGPIEAIQATGANKLQTIMYAVVPQMIPPFVSFSIYRWDINVRMSTIIGLVGGGGIGFLLVQYIRLLDYRAAGIAVWFIAITVAILDYVSAEIRQRFV